MHSKNWQNHFVESGEGKWWEHFNDPSRYKSRNARDATMASNIVRDDLPRRSPDLNVFDYCLWHNKRMRHKDWSFWPDFKETDLNSERFAAGRVTGGRRHAG
jgi:hypothetical protein